jgi:hypothetical protein
MTLPGKQGSARVKLIVLGIVIVFKVETHTHTGFARKK